MRPSSSRQRVLILFKLSLALYTEGTLDAAAFADYLARIEELGIEKTR